MGERKVRKIREVLVGFKKREMGVVRDGKGMGGK